MSERTPLDEPQLRLIYRETIDALYGYASRRCGGARDMAEDVTQETWLRAVRDWRAHGVPESPLAWLRAVARNLLLNQQRRPEGLPLDAVSSAEVLAAVEDNGISESAEIATVVRHALTRLSDAEARLLEAFHFDQCKVSQIAAAYGVSERAVEGRLRRARERLRHELELTLHHSST
jgi:RNA polymerase sigma-70 factor (ECF subfamily)